MNDARISSQQFVCLLGISSYIAALLFLPAPMAKEAGPDAWLTVPVSMCLGAVPVSLLLGLLVRRHPGMGFGDVAEFCLGKWGGRIVVLLLGCFALFVASLATRDIMDFSSIALLPGTPMPVLALLFAVTVAYTAHAGSEVIARLGVLVFLLALLTVIFMLLGVVREIDWVRVQPFLGNGFGPVLRGAWAPTGWFSQFFALAPFVFQISKPRKALGAMLVGNGIAAALLMLVVLVTVLVYSAPLTQKFTYPTYALATQVAIGQFLERLEISLLTVWLSGMVVIAASMLWSGLACLRWALGLKHAWWLTALVTGSVTWLTGIWPSELALAWFSTHYWTPYTLPFDIGLPVLLLGASFLRKQPRKGVST